MRYLNILLGLLMVGFAAVQYNDPDGLVWMAYYLGTAAWAFLAAFKPHILNRVGVRGMLWACLAVAIAGVVHYWPQMPSFWTKSVWFEEETAREGMGVMILTFVLLIAMISSRRRSK